VNIHAPAEPFAVEFLFLVQTLNIPYVVEMGKAGTESVADDPTCDWNLRSDFSKGQSHGAPQIHQTFCEPGLLTDARVKKGNFAYQGIKADRGGGGAVKHTNLRPKVTQCEGKVARVRRNTSSLFQRQIETINVYPRLAQENSPNKAKVRIINDVRQD
jgi:hypothetical protein